MELGLAGGRLLTPTVELGLRHDGGDAETGFGVELGGGTVFADAARGLTAQVTVRGMVAHEASDFRDCMLSGSLRFDPRPSSELGPAVALTPSWGGASSGGVAALLGRETLAGLAANDAPASGRLGAEAAYGLAVFGGRATGTPYLRLGQSETFREVTYGLSAGVTALGRVGDGYRGDAAREHRRQHGTGPRSHAALGALSAIES